MTTRAFPVMLALMLAPSSAAAAATRDWQKTFTVSGRPEVEVTTNDGRIRVHTGPAGEVRAEVHYNSHSWGWTFPSREPDVDLHQEGNSVTVTAREPSIFSFFGGSWMRLEIDVVVPADADLEVGSGDGSVRVEGPVSGRVTVHTGDGSIGVHGARGDVRLTSGDGAIEADDLDGSLYAHAGDGHVDVSGRFDRLDVHAGDGRVLATVARGSKLADDWRLGTQDGSLTVRIPRNLAAELDARTGDGSLHFDLPVEVSGQLRHHEVRGLLNGGGPLLRLRTGDGSLTLGVSD